jgi:hypothetical protein
VANDGTQSRDADSTMTSRPSRTLDEPELPCTVLVLIGPEGRRHRVRVGETSFRVGRVFGNDIVLPDAEVSRTHCVIEPNGRGVVVSDLGSTNGTWRDGRRADLPVSLEPGESVQIGRWTIFCDRCTPREMQRAEEVERELDRAGQYVQALLPRPISEGPVRVDWRFLPCASIGGDAFGYRFLDDRRFAVFMMDVAGHGAGSALLAASVMNLLRERSNGPMAPDQAEPAAVLGALNGMFQMDQQGGLFFSAWYGLYDLEARRLAFAGAGHHPGFLRAPGSSPVPLGTRNPAIGVIPEVSFRSDVASVPSGSRLILFSDGTFETVGPDGRQRGLADLLPALAGPDVAGFSEPERLLAAARAGARPGPFEDDVSILALDFA